MQVFLLHFLIFFLRTMESIGIKAFRKANFLNQKELATYLEISREFISQVENGKSRLPADKIRRLLSNDRGWDTSMLLPPTAVSNDSGVVINGANSLSGCPIDNSRQTSSEAIELLRSQIDLLSDLLKEKDGQIAKLLEIIGKK